MNSLHHSLRLNIRYTGALVVLAGTYLTYRTYRRPKNCPPGPLRIPILGTTYMFRLANFLEAFQEVVRIYGDVMLIYFGPNPYVFLSSPEAIREAFVKKGDMVSARPKLHLVDIMTNGKGIAMVDGPVWKEQRKFTVSVFRDIGVGKLHFEKNIQEALDNLRGYMKSKSGQTIDPGNEINKTVANVIGNIVFGSRQYARDSEDTATFIANVDENFRNIETGEIIDDFPFLKYLPGDMFGLQKTKHNVDFMLSYGRESVTWHRENPPEDGELRDFIDAYLQRMTEVENTDYGAVADFSDEQLLHIINDLFSAGIDTTASTVKWAVLYMAYHPEIQEKVREELNDIFPSGQPPTIHGRVECKYTEAVLYEVQRIATIAPNGLPHRATEDFTVGGFTVSKGMTVIPNLYGVHHNSRYWDDPLSFKPERFLDENGEPTGRQDAFMPFSVGRRMCLGDSLARMEMFLFFSTIMKDFSVRLIAQNPELIFKGNFGLTFPPKPYDVVFKYLGDDE